MFWFARFLAIAVLLLIVVYGIGLALPPERTVSQMQLVDASTDRVYRILTDVERQADWRRELRGVSVERRGDLWAWTETGGDGVDSRVEEKVKGPPLRYEVEFRNSDGVRGRRVAELQASEGRTRLTMTETRIIDAPLWRLPALASANPQNRLNVFLGELNRHVVSEVQQEAAEAKATGTAKPPKSEPKTMPTATATPTAIPTSTATPTPTPTVTPVPTSTPTPTAVPAAAPQP
jgi:hypothetical protein